MDNFHFMNNKPRKHRTFDDMTELEEMGFELTFEDFWQEVEAFAEQNLLSTTYVEEEFIIDGEFIPVHLTKQEDG